MLNFEIRSFLEERKHDIRARLARWPHARSGPGSVSWRVNGEVMVLAGWARAILLQLAHPAVAAGVHDHSQFRGSLGAGLGRLRATVRAMLSLTFGDTEQMVAAAARLHGIHDGVHGRVPGSARRYSAHDPYLQRWVHATLVDSILLTYERVVAPLSGPERDRYCAEATILEPLMGLPDGWLPRDAGALDTYLRGMLSGGTLVVSDTGRGLARAVLYPPGWRLAWPVFRAAQLLTIGSLPPAIRQAYGFEWRPRHQRALARWTRLLRALRRVLPRRVRAWPMASARGR
jgi:uncharacterized protein (DUF2236 family)